MTALRSTLALVLALGLPLSLACPALAKTGPIVVEHPWSRPTPPSAPTAVGYLTLVNHGRQADRLLRLDSPAAGSVSLHAMSMAGGVMRMRAVEGGLAVPAGGRVALDPNGLHLMFEGLKRPFKAGDRIPVTLVFQRAGPVRAALQVEAAGEAPAPAMDMKNMPGMDRRH